MKIEHIAPDVRQQAYSIYEARSMRFYLLSRARKEANLKYRSMFSKDARHWNHVFLYRLKTFRAAGNNITILK